MVRCSVPLETERRDQRQLLLRSCEATPTTCAAGAEMDACRKLVQRGEVSKPLHGAIRPARGELCVATESAPREARFVMRHRVLCGDSGCAALMLCRRCMRRWVGTRAATPPSPSLRTVIGDAAAKRSHVTTLEHAPRVSWDIAAPLWQIKPVASVHTDLPGESGNTAAMAQVPADVRAAMPAARVQAVAVHSRSDTELAERLCSVGRLGPAGILCLSGDARTRSGTPALLNIAHSLRSRGELSEHISFAVAANPQLDSDPSSLRMKLDAGAEVVFTQPSLLDGRMRRWFDDTRTMLADTPVLVGLACLTCVEDVRLWLRLCSIRDVDGAALLAAWQSATDEGPQAVDQLANKSLRQALEEAHTHGAAGVHVMPINTRGFKFAARVLPAELEPFVRDA